MDTHTISICSGYGGIELGLGAVVPGIRTVCYVENEASACEILGARIKDGLLDDAPIWTDLRTFDATAWRGRVHLITGGFPCQPHSVAGNRKGADDSRELSGEVLRIAEELGYPTLFLENVPGIRKFWYYNVRPRLQSMGYRVEEVLVTAAETGAPHKRQRLFILANNERLGIQVQAERKHAGKQVGGDHVTRSNGLYPPGPEDLKEWAHLLSEMPTLIPAFCRVANGATPWVDKQIRAIGNGVVPAVAARAWQILSRRFIEEVTTGYTDDF